MKTIHRAIPEIDTTIANTNKYFNQLEFKGIVEDKNIFNLDQESFNDALNVYVNSDGQFVSRDPLQKDISLPADPASYFGYELVEYKTISKFKLLIRKSPMNTYVVLLYDENNNYYELDRITKYNIAIIEHYIICFNDLGAKLFDTNADELKWRDLTEYAEIPVFKRVVGSQVTEYEKNAFTEAYKEEYVWSNQSRPTLPEASSADDTSIVLNTSTKKHEWTIPNVQLNTDYRILRQIDFIPLDTDIITIERDRICIARDTYFLVSFNGGMNFTTVYYPEFGGTFLRIASISKDGQYFFFVTTTGVYKCYLGNFTWAEIITLDNGLIKGEAIHNACNFLTGDVFCFITKVTTNGIDHLHVYCKGPGIYLNRDYNVTGKLLELIDPNEGPRPITILAYENQEYKDMYKNSISIYTDGIKTIIAISVPVQSDIYASSSNMYITTVHSMLYTIYGDNMEKYFDSSYEDNAPLLNINLIRMDHNLDFMENFITDLKFIILQNISPADDLILAKLKIDISCLIQERSSKWYQGSILFKIDQVGAGSYGVFPEWTKGNYLNQITDSIPFKLDGGYINGAAVYSDITRGWTSLPTKLDGQDFLQLVDNSYKRGTWVNGDYFYVQASNNLIYTNKLLDSDSALITYTYKTTNPFKDVPAVSYSDTELYLAFSNKLKITENSRDTKDNTKILFNLPVKNNQSFINNITAMINISTTDVALFFKDKVVLCSKVEDETLGYRYDYYNTKLSLGVRLGDSVMNTLEGSYTIFPTIRGLAIMNYQAFMATTDQVVEYITDGVKELWDKFYANGTVIKIIQHRSHLILTNGTKDILLYNISKQTWWRWQIPYNTLNTISDQIDLRLICRGELCLFTDKYIVNNEVKNLKYYDFSAHGENNTISWKVVSQPLHMKAINYYKNLKELIFQLFSDDENEETGTINVQIKLYRKSITLRDPSTVAFTIEKLRTFVKRFNYWKINEIQWGLANDTDTSLPTKLKLNGISIKYELGDEVR